jgi:hypothetical protein
MVMDDSNALDHSFGSAVYFLRRREHGIDTIYLRVPIVPLLALRLDTKETHESNVRLPDSRARLDCSCIC